MADNGHFNSDGIKEFSIEYSGREISCTVEKNGSILHLHMDNGIDADLEIQDDGSLVQRSGPELPASSIDYVRKRVLGHDAGGSTVSSPGE